MQHVLRCSGALPLSVSVASVEATEFESGEMGSTSRVQITYSVPVSAAATEGTNSETRGELFPYDSGATPSHRESLPGFAVITGPPACPALPLAHRSKRTAASLGGCQAQSSHACRLVGRGGKGATWVLRHGRLCSDQVHGRLCSDQVGRRMSLEGCIGRASSTRQRRAASGYLRWRPALVVPNADEGQRVREFKNVEARGYIRCGGA